MDDDFTVEEWQDRRRRRQADDHAGESLSPGADTNVEPLDPGEQSKIDRRYLALLAQVLDIEGMRNIPRPAWLVEGYLRQNSLGWLGGKPGNAKSFIAADIACSVGTGIPWHGHQVAQGRVLYLIAEGASDFWPRIDAWAEARGRPVQDVLFLPVPIRMMEDLDVSAFCMLLRHLQPILVILDTQARVTVGADENSSKDMGQFVDNLEELRRQSGACILVVHHEPRNGEHLRGSTALEGAAATILRASKDGTLVEVSNPKQKDAPEQPPMLLALTPSGPSVSPTEAVGLGNFTTESEDQILRVLWDLAGTGEVSQTALREAVELPKSTWYRSINSLVKKGKVRERKHGNGTLYRVPFEQDETLVP